MGKELKEGALHLKINTLHSSWMENKGGGKFVLKPLPDGVQSSMVNGFVMDDFDDDGQKEILCAGNFYPYKVEWGRSDTFMGALLKFKNGEATVYKPDVSLRMKGDIRDLQLLKTKSGKQHRMVFP